MTENGKNKWEQFHDEAAEADVSEEQTTDAAEAIEPGLPHPDYQQLEEKLTEAEQRAHEYWEKLVRQTAELDNVRRRAERDIEQAHRYSLEQFAEALLPVVDSLDQALMQAPQGEQNAMYEGISLTMKLFSDTLAKFGLTVINPEGGIFNPQEHEAISMIAVPDAAPNSIVNVFQKGYRLHDRVVRPARVIVAKS